MAPSATWSQAEEKQNNKKYPISSRSEAKGQNIQYLYPVCNQFVICIPHHTRCGISNS